MESNLPPPNKQLTLRVAHESLLKSWQLARDQIKQDQGRLLIRARLEKLSQRWYAAAPEIQPGLLLPAGLQLEEAEDLLNAWGEELPLEMRAHIEASIQAKTQRQQQERKTREELERRLVEANHNLGLVLLEKATQAVERHDQPQAIVYTINALAKLKPDANSWQLITNVSSVFVNTMPLLFRTAPSPVMERAGVRCLAISPDQRILASGMENNIVRLWDLTTGTPLTDLIDHTAPITSLAFNAADDLMMASGSEDMMVLIWKLNSFNAQMPSALKHKHTSAVTALAFSPDSLTLVTGSAEGAVRIWDAVTGELLAVPPGQVGLGRGCRIGSGANLGPFGGQGHTGAITRLVFSADGSMLASASADKTIRVWNLKNKEAQVLAGHTDVVTSIAFHPNGRILASGSQDKTVRLWDLARGKQQLVLNGHTGAITGLIFGTNQHTLASVSADQTMCLWSIEHPRPDLLIKRDKAIMILKRGANAETSAVFTPDGNILATGLFNGSVFLWSLVHHWNLINNIYAIKHNVQQIKTTNKISLNGIAIVANVKNTTIYLRNETNDTEIAVLNGHTSRIDSIVFNECNGKPSLISRSKDSAVYLWDLSLLFTLYQQYLSDSIGDTIPKLEQQFGYTLNGLALHDYPDHISMLVTPHQD